MRLVLAALALLTLAACDTTDGGCSGGTNCPPGPLPGDEVVAGVNLTALFAPSTQAERDSVAARLARTGGTDAPRVTQVAAVELQTDADGTRYQRLTLRDAGGRAVGYGVARIPANDLGGGAPLPVLFLLPDGSGDAAEASFLTGNAVLGLDRQTVQIVLAARGAALTTRGVGPNAPPLVTASDVPADPYRADVLDALALAENLGGVLRANRARVGLLGVGRGATVALLAAERTPGRFRVAASLGAVTDLFDATVRTDVRRALLGGPPSTLPAAAALLAPAQALASGDISLQEARLRMLELSPVALQSRLPSTVALHADPDDVVPFAQFERFRALGSGTVEARRRFETVPEVGHAGVITNASARAIFSQFINETL